MEGFACVLEQRQKRKGGFVRVPEQRIKRNSLG